MFKDFLLRKMMEKQLKNVPPEMREKMITMITKNPELFQKIALEVQAKVDGGMDKMAAAKQVLAKYQNEIPKID
jgi:uncharacterized protein YneF (UPF0154 family)